MILTERNPDLSADWGPKRPYALGIPAQTVPIAVGDVSSGMGAGREESRAAAPFNNTSRKASALAMRCYTLQIADVPGLAGRRRMSSAVASLFFAVPSCASRCIMLTALELKFVHIAYRQAGLDEEQYRMVLRSVAGVASAKELNQTGMENVMAVFEDSGFRHAGKPDDYWRMKVALRGSYCGARMAHKIEGLAAGQKYDLAGLCRRVSKDRVCRVDKLSPREGLAMIEMLKAICRREEAVQIPVCGAAEAAGGSPEPRSGARMPFGGGGPITEMRLVWFMQGR